MFDYFFFEFKVSDPWCYIVCLSFLVDWCVLDTVSMQRSSLKAATALFFVQWNWNFIQM